MSDDVKFLIRDGARVELRPLGPADESALRSFLLEDVWSHVYLLGILHWWGIAGRRARFVGAFAEGRLAGVLGEGREVHCWFASVAARTPDVAALFARELAPPRVQVLLGREDLIGAALAALPEARRGRTRPHVLGVSHDAMPAGQPAHPVRRATRNDLPGLVALYEGYEFDGYPTRRHVWRALAERIEHSGIWVVERDGRLVAARRLDASSPEVVLFGGLTVDPAYRGSGLGWSLRLASQRELRARGLPHCSLRDPENPLATAREYRPHAQWLIANLRVPPPPAWRTLGARVWARVSPWDRPCVRRRATLGAA